MTIKAQLIEAEEKALLLFNTIEARGLITAGKSEKQLNTEIFNLAKELYGIEKYWHKRIVRTGPNTLHPYNENPPDLIIREDDILFIDFGPVFEDWEADFGRTYVIGNDPLKHKLKNDIESAWQETKDWFGKQEQLTGAQLYHYTVELARQYGWTFGGEIAGHIIGQFPHERLVPGTQDLYVHPDNHQDMFTTDKNGQPREWILEIHFIDAEKQIGGFFEQLLT
ncbi:metallopeptidase family M24 [Chitinophaga niastensis]|uniref:Metallopeptidase family M24 n=1 Tax=Chitinophaga niastensis TaxID=536980 RepID=A0A2P8HEW5_CHINA|nr:M24 family metallopeptidase [Chitinophaga niastensis]PSL44758.1 metallopeptidase family M24 [Chitinophaga niastensis]